MTSAKLGSIRVGQRFCGPPGFGNGGYVCALLARYVHNLNGDEAALIRLHQPVPLQQPLDVWRMADASLQLQQANSVLATCRVGKLAQQVPTSLAFSEAEQIAKSCPGFHYHPFPDCFVCGPQRLPGDGLRIFPGRLRPMSNDNNAAVEFHNLVAAPWIPDESLAGKSAKAACETAVASEFIWAALDCTGSFPIDFGADKVLVLGQFKVRLLRPVIIGEKCVVMGWLKSIEGRKHFTETVLFNANGEVCGLGEAIWIQLQN